MTWGSAASYLPRRGKVAMAWGSAASYFTSEKKGSHGLGQCCIIFYLGEERQPWSGAALHHSGNGRPHQDNVTIVLFWKKNPQNVYSGVDFGPLAVRRWNIILKSALVFSFEEQFPHTTSPDSWRIGIEFTVHCTLSWGFYIKKILSSQPLLWPEEKNLLDQTIVKKLV